MVKRWMALVIGAVIIVCVAVDGAGEIYLDRCESWNGRQLEAENARADAFRRAVIADHRLDQNAAAWYRLVFAHVKEGLAEHAAAVATLSLPGHRRDPSVLDRTASEYCDDAQSMRMESALRSSRLNWGLTALGNEEQVDSRIVWLLGSCLVINGHRYAAGREFDSAASSYLDALSFASDLGQADFSTSFVGMAIARSALESITALLPEFTENRLLERISLGLSANEKNIPTFAAAIRLSALRAASDLESDARLDFQRRPRLRLIVPMHAFEACRLFRSVSLLRRVLMISEANEPSAYEPLAASVDDQVKSSSEPSIRADIPRNLLGAKRSERYLYQLFTATEASLIVRQWSVKHGHFPADDTPIRHILKKGGLRYSLINGGRGYRISGDSVGATRVVVAEASER